MDGFIATYNHDIAHMLGAGILLLSFSLLLRRRMISIIKAFGAQAFLLACAAAWQALVQHEPHLFITAAIALVLKAIIIPVVLHRITRRLRINRDSEMLQGKTVAMIVAVSLVALSIFLVFPVVSSEGLGGTQTRESLAIALSVVLLGFLMMITRQHALSQVVGFMSLENGLILAAVSVMGMPLVVEVSIAFSVMVAFIIFGIFFFHIRERFETLDTGSLNRFREGQND